MGGEVIDRSEILGANGLLRLTILLLGLLAVSSWTPLRAERVCEGPQNVGDPTTRQVEMAISVHPIDADRQVIAVTRPSSVNRKIRSWSTTDGGRSWSEATIEPPAVTGYSNKPPFSDPAVAHDDQGNVHLVYLLNRRCCDSSNPCGCYQERAVISAKSTDGGITYSPSIVAPLYLSSAARTLDKPWIAADRDPASPGHGNLYVAWTHAGSAAETWISTSTDRGNSWGPPVSVTTSSFFAGLAVGPEGNVYTVWFKWGQGNRRIGFRNLGVGAGAFQSAIDLADIHDSHPTTTAASPGRVVYSVPSVAVDSSDGPNRGRVWVAYSDFSDSGDPDRMRVYVTWSDDGGTTWFGPTDLGKAGSSQFLPWLSVDPQDGSVSVVYYSTEGDPSDEGAHVYLRSLWDGSPGNPADWVERRLSAIRSDPDDDGRHGEDYREYIGLDEKHNVAYASWTSRHRGLAQIEYARVPGPLNQAASGGVDEPVDRHGEALATGDFDGDGYIDLAVATPYENNLAIDDGEVAIHYGSPDGLVPTRWERIGQNSLGAPSENDDRFGEALAAGDFDKDGYVDLAVGIPGEDGVSTDEGAVAVFRGSSAGLVPANGVLIDQGDLGMDRGTNDRFGATLAAADFNGDGYVDLAVGVPTEDDLAFEDGIVTLLYGSPSGLTTTGVERIRQSDAGMVAQDSDQFGEALAAGDFNGDGRGDLAVGIPSEDDEATDSGNVLVFFGSSQGLLPADTERLSQPDAGRPSENGDRFGAALAAGDFNGDGRDDLAVGVPDEYHNQPEDGAVIVYLGATAGLLPPTTELLLQTTGGETMESGDRFGRSLATGNLDGDAYDELVVGIPLEDDTLADSGALIAFYGSINGLVPANPELLRQPDLGAASESGDQFASALAIADFNGDCIGDLAASAPREDLWSGTDAGAVLISYGSAGGLLAPPSERLTGDVNCDGCVDYADRQTVLQGLGLPNQCGTDVTGDGVVDVADLDLQQTSCGLGACGVACTDGDCDGYGASGDPSCPLGTTVDCADDDPDVRRLPGETPQLSITATASSWEVHWEPPVETGGEPGSLVYDVLRATFADNFFSSTVCVESDDGSDRVAVDGSTPPPGTVYHYLVRGGNACGDGSLGVDSSGVPRSGRTCP